MSHLVQLIIKCITSSPVIFINISIFTLLYTNLVYLFCATNQYFQILGNIHDIESFNSIDNISNVNLLIFTSHWIHLTILNCWSAAIIFHIGWQGNFEFWINNPVKIEPIAHSIFDLYMSSYDPESDIAFSGLYNLLITIGFTTTIEIYQLTILLQLSVLIIGCISLTNSSKIPTLP